MGMSGKDLQLLLRLSEEGHIKHHGKVVEIGAQQLSNDFLRSRDLIRRAETVFSLKHPISVPDSGPSILGAGGIELQSRDAPLARDFWISLGFEYAAIDVDESPGSIPLDLNYDEVPVSMRCRFDVVTNLGTTEHICNQLNAFKAIHELAETGAVMIHHLPAGGALNHGIINYNPKFFWHLARSNDYKWLYMNYYSASEFYELPSNILDAVTSYEPAMVSHMRGCKTADYGLQVAFQKTLDIGFVPPLDVDTGVKTGDEALKRRYWTVFQPELLRPARSGELPDLQLPPTEADVVSPATKHEIRSIVNENRLFVVKELRRLLARAPSRRFTALIAALSTGITAIIFAGALIGAKAFHLF